MRRKMIHRQQLEQDRAFTLNPIPILIIVGLLLLTIPVISYFSYQRYERYNELSEETTRLVCELWTIAQGETLNTYTSFGKASARAVSTQKAILNKKFADEPQLAEAIQTTVLTKRSFQKSVEERAEYVCGAQKRHIETFFNILEEL